MNDHEWLRVHTSDGRALEVLRAGAHDGLPAVFHNGTPTAAAFWPALHHMCAQRNLHLLTFSRSGYAESSPHPGRTVADVAGDVAAILDHLGEREFITFGWSGGGPHALACAALLPRRCLAAATIASVAPRHTDDAAWLAGMGPENVEEFTLAFRGPAALRPFLLTSAAELADIAPRQLADALGGLIPDVDREALTGEFAAFTAEAFRRALSAGVEGWLEDDLAFVKPWGFEVSALSRPVAIWQGGQDRMVPFAHGEWLAAHVSGAEAHLLPEEGHLSLGVGNLPLVIDGLVRLAGRGS